MGKLKIVDTSNMNINLPSFVEKNLELLQCNVVIDYILEEIQFIVDDEKDEIIVFDFDANNIQFAELECENIDMSYKNNITEADFEKIEDISKIAGTDIFFIGEGNYQNLVIKIFSKYFVLTNILIDSNDDYDPFDPDDPDDGESMPVDDTGYFFALYLKIW